MKDIIKQKLRERLETMDPPFLSLLNDVNAKEAVGKKNMFVCSIGGSELYFKKANTPRTIEIDLITTEQSQRGSGGASALLSKFLESIDAFGFNVELMVSPRDKQTDPRKLVNFYKKFGFVFQQMHGFDSDFEMIRYKKKSQAALQKSVSTP